MMVLEEAAGELFIIIVIDVIFLSIYCAERIQCRV
jgi:hypothetical protein